MKVELRTLRSRATWRRRGENFNRSASQVPYASWAWPLRRAGPDQAEKLADSMAQGEGSMIRRMFESKIHRATVTHLNAVPGPMLMEMAHS